MICAGPDHPPLLRMFENAGVRFDTAVSMMWVEKHGETLGGFAWSEWKGPTIQAHFVGKSGRWMTPEIVRRSFTYPFNQLGVRVILAFLPIERATATRVALKMGFKELCVIPEIDIRMLALTRKDCTKWLAMPSRGGNG